MLEALRSCPLTTTIDKPYMSDQPVVIVKVKDWEASCAVDCLQASTIHIHLLDAC